MEKTERGETQMQKKNKAVLILPIVHAIVLSVFGIVFPILISGPEPFDPLLLVMIGLPVILWGCAGLICGIFAYRGKKAAAVFLILFGISPPFLNVVAGIMALSGMRKQESESADAVQAGQTEQIVQPRRMGQAELVFSIFLTIATVSALIMGAMMWADIFIQIPPAFTFGAQTSDAAIRENTKFYGILMLMMCPSLLLYYATANIKLKKAGRIVLTAIGLIGMVAFAVVYELRLRNTTDMDALLSRWVLELSPWVGLIGYPFLAFFPAFTANRSPFAQKVGRFIANPVVRFLYTVAMIGFLMYIAVGIIALIVLLVVLWVIGSIVSSERANYGTGTRTAQGDGKVFLLRNVYAEGDELRLRLYGRCKLLEKEAGYHQVYQDNLGHFWISDDEKAFTPLPYPLPTDLYIITY